MSDVLIIGIATVDAIARPVDRIPEPGGLRFFDNLTLATGGCAINAAIALARLGTAADLIARVGRDIFGEFIVGELRRSGVPTAGIQHDPEVGTSFSFAAVGSTGERRFFHATGANARLRREDIPSSSLRNRRFVFVTGAMLMDALDGQPTADLLAAARGAGAQTVLDTVYVESATPEEWQRRIIPALPHVDYFVPSRAEARAITGQTDPPQQADRLHSLGAKNVVIKLDSQGAFCRGSDGQPELAPAFPVANVVDTTGAGDCWCAGLLVGLLAGKSLVDAARLGNAVAAFSIQSPGAATGVPSLSAVESRIGVR